jgi:uncharacterized membrane protein YbhN (UPF0104 family)
VLHPRSGDVRIDEESCRALQCEPGIASTFGHARLGLLGLLLAAYGFGTLAWAARWRALLAFAGVEVPLPEMWRLSIEAQAGGILLPGGLGGDALRIASVLGRPGRERGSRASAVIVVASVLLDRAVGLAILSGVALVLAAAVGSGNRGGSVFALAVLPLGFVTAVAVLRTVPMQRVAWLTGGRAGRVVRPVLEYVRHPGALRAIATAAALSVIVAVVQLTVIRGFVAALGGAPKAERWVYVGSAMAFIVGALPALPGGWGTADAAYVFFLGKAGLAAPTALAVCLLYRLFWYISGIVGAVLHLARRRAATPSLGAGRPRETPE